MFTTLIIIVSLVILFVAYSTIRAIAYSKSDAYKVDSRLNTYGKRYLSFAILATALLASVQTAKADGLVNPAVYTVPTSLCNDPLLGPSMIIHTDCNQEQDKESDDSLHGVSVTEPIATVVVDTTVIDDNPVTTPDNDTSTPVDDTESDSNDDNSKIGNPGNGKPVGHAGEQCDKGMCENADGNTGEHGKSHRD